MEWWTHLWLNEGFARFMEHVAVHELFPDWNMWTQYGESVFSLALDLDCLATTHPVEVEVGHPDEVNEIFDTISYAKGSAVIRMLQTYLGADTFDNGIRGYLAKHQYENATTADLWAALEEANGGAAISDMMNGWTQQEGYPAITVEELPPANAINFLTGNNNGLVQRKFKLTQRRFTKGAAAAAKAAADKTTWQIPIVAVTSGGAEHRFVMTEAEQIIEIPVNLNDGRWIKVNAGQAGFYRVNMQPSQINNSALAKALSAKELAPLDRLGLISDAFAFAATSKASGNKPPAAAGAALALVAGCSNETDLYVWKELAGHLKKYLSVFGDEDGCGDALKALVSTTITPTAERLGWSKVEGEPEVDTLMRTVALSLLAATNHPPTVAEAIKQFEAGTYASDLRPVVLSLVV